MIKNANNKSQAAYQLRMNVVFDYMEKQLDYALSIESLSQQANFPPFHFHK